MTTPKQTNEQTLTDLFEEDIIFGRLRPRERLVEDDLMERTGATRHAVRSALADMELRHLVIRVPNKGAQVRDFDREDVKQICDMRDWLHERAARAIRFPVDADWLEGLEQLQREHDAAVASSQPMAVHRTNSAFHAALFAGCENHYLAKTINEYAQLSLAYRCHLMTRSDLAHQAAAEHWQMIEALSHGDADKLAEVCVNHTKAARAVYESLQGWGAKAP